MQSENRNLSRLRMKLNLRNRNLSLDNSIDTLIENALLSLAKTVQIDEAHVLVERRPETSPAFHVSLHLKVPGLDLRSERIDHTPTQAFDRALAEIVTEIARRTGKRRARVRTPGPRTVAGRRMGRTSRG